jgi:hypothetical protein
MRSRTDTILLLATLLVGAGSSHAQQGLQENPYHLRSDERLQVRLNLDTERPKLPEIIAKLREVTQLDLAVDESLSGHDPYFGTIQPSENGFRAWQLMEMVAKRDLQKGYWEKTDTGYRLRGQSTQPAATPPDKQADPSGLSPIWFVTGILIVVLVVLLVIRRATAGSSSPRIQEANQGSSGNLPNKG